MDMTTAHTWVIGTYVAIAWSELDALVGVAMHAKLPDASTLPKPQYVAPTELDYNTHSVVYDIAAQYSHMEAADAALYISRTIRLMLQVGEAMRS